MAYADNYIEYHYHPDLKKILNDNWLFPTYIWNDGSEWYGIKEVQSVVIYKNKIFICYDELGEEPDFNSMRNRLNKLIENGVY